MKPEQIRKLRIKSGMTQVDVARAVGVSLVGFRNWENGGGKPKAENLKKLEEVLSYDETA